MLLVICEWCIGPTWLEAADFLAQFHPRMAPDPSSFAVEISAPLAGSSTDSSSISGDATIAVTQPNDPFGTAQLLDVDMTLVDGMSFSLLGGTVSVEAAPGAAHVRMIEAGPSGTVVNGRFDQLENLFEFRGEVMLSTQETPFDLSTVAPITADLLGIQLENRGPQLVASLQVDLEFTAAVSTPAGQLPLAILLQGNLEAIAPLHMLADFNGDQVVDANDIDLLHEAIRTGSDDLRFDLDFNGLLNDQDANVMVQEILNTYFGDANLDGQFDTNDLITVFASGVYEDSIPLNAGWVSGDWDGDGDFTSGDLVHAVRSGCFESCLGPRAATAAVPEPSSAWIVLSMCIVLGWSHRRIPRGDSSHFPQDPKKTRNVPFGRATE